MHNNKTYPQWNGKNINGKAEENNDFLSQEAKSNSSREMNCSVTVDTFSADELQEDVTY